MKNQKYSSLHDSTYVVGLVAVFICAFTFLCGKLFDEESFETSVFIIIYVILQMYWLPLLFRFAFCRKNFNADIIYPALIISFISCFSLNRLVNIFDDFPVWYGIAIVVVSCSFMLIPLFDSFPKKMQQILSFILGVGSVVLLYLTIYLAPLYVFSLVAFVALGISLHTFVPLVMLVTLLCRQYRQIRNGNKRNKNSFWTGICLAILFVAGFTIVWSYEVNKIDNIYESRVSGELFPEWMSVAQHTSPNLITNKILKTGLVYHVPDWRINSIFNTPSKNFSEKKLHDPLVVTAIFLAGETKLTNDEKIKILESVYNSRYQAVERLWSDKGLRTTNLETSVEIWPQYRIAYTEQVIKIRNDQAYWRQGEAVYAFHLPEGSVVTSLSLWIAGEERKGILTTKEKANTAYETIVGIESRDPSLVHWQEGSTVIVRVFPVTTKEERQFKIGVTTPLQISGNRIKYEPISFDGADFSKAKEDLNIRFMQEPEDIHYPSFLKKEKNETCKYRGTYKNDWQITMKQTPVSKDFFQFNGNRYFVGALEHYATPLIIRNIYLDVNRSWTKNEFDAVCKLSAGKRIWVWCDSKMLQLNEQNRNEIFSELQALQFSVFPVHLIENLNESMLLSKSTLISPNMKELENTSFLKELKSRMNPSEKILFYNLGDNLSPYLQTLQEYRILEYGQGDLGTLRNVLQTNKFPKLGLENEHSIAIEQSGISINREEISDKEKKGTAPDHLMRLFAYNHILKQYTRTWDGDDLISKQLLTEAQEANIVSPVSSLLVLETQTDYVRFDIRQAENSIGNAETTKNTPVGDWNIWIILGMLGMYAVKRRLCVSKNRLSRNL